MLVEEGNEVGNPPLFMLHLNLLLNVRGAMLYSSLVLHTKGHALRVVRSVVP